VLGVDQEVPHFHEFAGGHVEDCIQHLHWNFSARRIACRDVLVGYVTVGNKAGQYGFLRDGSHLGLAVCIVGGCVQCQGFGSPVEDADIGDALQSPQFLGGEWVSGGLDFGKTLRSKFNRVGVTGGEGASCILGEKLLL
jgi:hypothetical protein